MGLVGAEQTTNPEYPLLAASLLVSRSGKYWNREHPLLTIENIDQAIKNFSHYNYTAYSAGTTYSLGMKVRYSSVNYEYINATPSAGNTPPNATYWAVIDSLSDYLTKTDYAATDRTVDSVLNIKKLHGQIKSIYNNKSLFSGRANRSDTVTNEGKMVGLSLTLRNHRSLITIIQNVGHQFDGALNDIPLYLYHTSQVEPLAEFSFDHTKPNGFEITTLTTDNILRYLSDDHDVGGSFLIAYFQDDLDTVKAIRKDISWNTFERCCDVKEDYLDYSPFVKVNGFSIDSAYLDGINLPDPEYIYEDPYSNYGLNLNLTTKCDLTPFFIQQEELLAEVKSLNMAYLILQDMANSTRGSNALANQVAEMANKQVYSYKDAYGTINDRLVKATKGLNFDLSGLNDACLPSDEMVIKVGSY